jgi:hypothetical protein
MFYSGCLGRATNGIEIGGLGIIDLDSYYYTFSNVED